MPDRQVAPAELGEISRLVAAEALERIHEELANPACNPDRISAYASVVDAAACFTSEDDDE